MPNDPTFYADGHTPRRTDTELQVTQKILGALIDGASTATIYNTTTGTQVPIHIEGTGNGQQIVIGS